MTNTDASLTCYFPELLAGIRRAVADGQHASYLVLSSSGIMENLLMAVTHTCIHTYIYAHIDFGLSNASFFLFINHYSARFFPVDPEKQPDVPECGVRIPVAKIDRQQRVQRQRIRGDARVRHHQSQTRIVSVHRTVQCSLVNNNNNNNGITVLAFHPAIHTPKPPKNIFPHPRYVYVSRSGKDSAVDAKRSFPKTHII